ncbi:MULTISPECIES: hypothetical protein [unclassified Streptomyces]
MTTVEPIQGTDTGQAPTSGRGLPIVPLRRWLALVAVAVGTFAMVTAE